VTASAYVHRAGSSAVVGVVYRPGSCNSTQGFFDDFYDLLERLATYSAPLLIVGDFNIDVGDTTDTGAGKLHEILTTYGLSQHIRSSTHRHGHTLDLLITRDDQAVNVLPTDPALLSDHSFVVANLDCAALTGQSMSVCQIRNRREVDVDALVADLQCSDLSLRHLTTWNRRSSHLPLFVILEYISTLNSQ